MSYKGEIVAKAVDTLLQDSLAAAIAAIEAEWSADPIELNDIGTWHMGYRPVTLEQTKDQFPIITIMIGSSVPTGTADQFVLATSLYDVFINVDVVGSSDEVEDMEAEEVVTKKLFRYVQAIINVLESNSQIADDVALQLLPSVEISDVERQIADGVLVFCTQRATLGMQVES